MRRPGSPTAPTSPLTPPSRPTAGRSALEAASGALGAIPGAPSPIVVDGKPCDLRGGRIVAREGEPAFPPRSVARPTWTAGDLRVWLERFPDADVVYLGLRGEHVALHGIERITTDTGVPALLLRPREE